MSGTFARRALTVLLLGPVFLGLILAGPRVFGGGLAVLVLVGGWELWRMLVRLGFGAPPVLPLLAIVLFGASALDQLGASEIPLVLLGWASALLFLARASGGWHPRGAAPALAAHVLGAVYVGVLPSFLVRLYDANASANATVLSQAGSLLFAVFLIWACDTGAYLVGSRWGRHLLWPAVSPKKTWEGAIGGGLAVLAAAVFLAGPLETGLTRDRAAWLALGVAIAAPLGDLVESRLKRVANMKDSSSLLPGHGGILDRFDSLFFVAPFFYYTLRALGR